MQICMVNLFHTFITSPPPVSLKERKLNVRTIFSHRLRKPNTFNDNSIHKWRKVSKGNTHTVVRALKHIHAQSVCQRFDLKPSAKPFRVNERSTFQYWQWRQQARKNLTDFSCIDFIVNTPRRSKYFIKFSKAQKSVLSTEKVFRIYLFIS